MAFQPAAPPLSSYEAVTNSARSGAYATAVGLVIWYLRLQQYTAKNAAPVGRNAGARPPSSQASRKLRTRSGKGREPSNITRSPLTRALCRPDRQESQQVRPYPSDG